MATETPHVARLRLRNVFHRPVRFVPPCAFVCILALLAFSASMAQHRWLPGSLNAVCCLPLPRGRS